MKIKGIAIACVVAAAVILATIFWPKGNTYGQIVSTSYVGFDFARAVTGEETMASPLLPPGADMHGYEPTPQDIVSIQEAKLFIYIGGESEEWVERLIKDNEISADKTLRLMDFVELKKEEVKDGMETEEEEEGDEEYDEHIWTSPKNAVRLINAIRDKLTSINFMDATKLEQNAKSYTDHLEDLDQRFASLFKGAPQKTLIFGDRFPFRYFVDEYGVDYYAAFPGCSEQTEPSAATVAFLTEKARELGVKMIFKTENSDGRLAQTIADNLGIGVRTLYSAHNVTKDNIGKRYVDMLEENLAALQETLY